MANENQRDRRVKRRIAATAATAALALSGPAAATARPAATRTPVPPRPGGDPVTRLVHSDSAEAQLSLDVSRRAEMASHRRKLAGALAAELGGADARSVERALEATEAELSAAYSRGERPAFVDGIPAALTSATGTSEAELTAAFESMSRHALERRRLSRS
ncbi:MAG: hypothetical protein U0R51_00605 [Solirubrobacterales bacterium]